MKNRDITVIIVNCPHEKIRFHRNQPKARRLQSDLNIPVVIVDDQMVMRVGLKFALEKISGVKVVAEATDGDEAIDMATRHRPAVIFMDVSMPNKNGIQATEAIKASLPETRIIMFTSNDDEGAFLSALSAGADGYCLKDATEKQLESAMNAVLQGAKWLDSGLANRVLVGTGSRHSLNRSFLDSDQKKILQLIEAGLDIAEIADKLGDDVTDVKINLRTAVDGLEPNALEKKTRIMSNLRSMLERSDTSKSFDVNELKLGEVVSGKYRIEKILGKGGMSVVYLARHVVLGKLVAIKMMHHNMVATGSALQRFEREAKLASSLNHPNIVGVHDFGEDKDGQPYLVMDYVSGDTLDEIIEQSEKLDAGFCVPVFVQLCDALSAMHDKGIVHRDLKPSNVLVKIKSSGAQVTLLDLGIAKSVAEGNNSVRLTAAGQLFGSPTYMSPEQCIGWEVDFRSDLYSLGCMMYNALAGDPPFLNENAYNVMWQHVNEPPSRLPFLADDCSVPESLQSIVFKLLHKDADCRYQTAAELREELAQLVCKTS
jgi:DNA-binding NarL/FixJ family response regulator/tRNA A-37 threonylcarbamoyl transferase component Bud32